MRLPEEDVTYFDKHIEHSRVASRSAALHEAIKLLRISALESACEDAAREWEADEDAVLWDSTAADGLSDAARSPSCH